MSSPRRTPEEVNALLRERYPEGKIVAEHTANEHWYRYTPSGALLPSVTAITGMMPAPHLKKWAVNVGLDHLEDRIVNGLELAIGKPIPQDIREAVILAHDDKFHDAGDIGTQGHKVIEKYIDAWMETGRRPEDITTFITGEDARLWAIARSAEKFMRDYMVIPVASELLVANPKDGYAGTLDFLAFVAFPESPGVKTIDGKPCVHEIASNAKAWWKIHCDKCKARWQYHFTLVDWKTSNTIWKEEYCMQATAYWKALKVLCGVTVPRIVIVRLDKDQMKYEPLEVFDRAGTYKAFLGLKKGFDYLRMSSDLKCRGFFTKEKISLTPVI